MLPPIDLLITDCTLVGPSSTLPHQDIAISAGKILVLGQNLSSYFSASKTINARRAYVTPGGIDSHVHLAQENAPSGDDWESGTRSAIAGGTTTVIGFAVQKRTDDSVIEVVEKYHELAKGKAYCDYGFHLILTNPTPKVVDEELPKIVEGGVSSVKLYMTYEPLKLGDREMLDVMMCTRRLGMTTMIHAENADMIAWLTARLESKNLTIPYAHALSRPPIAEDEATYRIISLATLADVPILIVHMSSSVAASHVRDAQTKLIPIHAETCPHYLVLTASALRGDGTPFSGAKCVCAPALREDPADLEAMWQGIANGTFTTFSSDHAPDSFEHEHGKKAALAPHNLLANGEPTFRRIPNGLPGVETRLPMLMSEGVMGGKIGVQKFVEVTSANHAALYGMAATKGTLAPGFDADLVIWYSTPEQAREGGGEAMTPFMLENGMLHHAIDYTPFEGMEYKNWPRYTILRGEVVWDRDGAGLVGKMGYGEFLKRGRSTLSQPRQKWVNTFRASED